MSRLVSLVLIVLLSTCASKMPAEAQVERFTATAPPPLPALAPSPFGRDRFSLTEEQFAAVLSHSSEVDPQSRIGVVRVAEGYAPENSVPIDDTPRVLADAIEVSTVVRGASEVSTEWPSEAGLPGLRELAARYRARYLVLYRNRFVSQQRANGWAAGYLTLVGLLFMPGTTYEQSGVLEATLFDAMSGSVLFTVHERVQTTGTAAPPSVEQTMRESQAKLLRDAAPKLAAEVVARCRKLASKDVAAPGAVSVISGQ